MSSRTSASALVVQRFTGDAPSPTKTAELHDIVRATGCRVVGTLTQQRESDPASEIGSGKLETLRETVTTKEADVVVFNQRLSPYQIYNIASGLPDGVEVWGEYRLYIEALSERAVSHREQLQVKLLRLRYDLPRVEAKQNLKERTYNPKTLELHKYTDEYDRELRDRIKSVHSELDSLATQEEARRNKQRDNGITHVTVIGYTNSGKSSLFNNLTGEESPQVVSPGALETFETRTRRHTKREHDVLFTDTLGITANRPYWMHDSLKVSLAPIVSTDVLLICANMNQPLPILHERLVAVREFIESFTTAVTDTVTVFTHADVVPEEEQLDKLAALEEIAPDAIVVDTTDHSAVESVTAALNAYTPTKQRETFQVPLSDTGMSFVSWLHDNATIESKQYRDGEVMIEIWTDSVTVGKARAEFSQIHSTTANSD